jgi:hypothetical protein
MADLKCSYFGHFVFCQNRLKIRRFHQNLKWQNREKKGTRQNVDARLKNRFFDREKKKSGRNAHKMAEYEISGKRESSDYH